MSQEPPASSAEIVSRLDGAVAQIRFNRPAKLNAINLRLASQFRQACEEHTADPRVRVIVLSGEGRSFMAGGDIAEMDADPMVAARLIEDMHHGLMLLSQAPVPVIGSVHGSIAGGGFGVALSCDLCIAADESSFCMAYPLIGASADCGTTWGLARLVGLRKAMEIALLSEPISAKRAHELGIVNLVVPQAELATATQRLAERLAEGPTKAYGHVKALLKKAAAHGYVDHLNAESGAFLSCADTQDFREGTKAFLEKRRPSFTGQ